MILFRRDDVFHHWYVNFERPMTRSPVGFAYLDRKLDLVVPVDGERRLHDEDDLWRPDPAWPVPQLVPGWDRV